VLLEQREVKPLEVLILVFQTLLQASAAVVAVAVVGTS
jgi:hypothetical protein